VVVVEALIDSKILDSKFNVTRPLSVVGLSVAFSSQCLIITALSSTIQPSLSVII